MGKQTREYYFARARQSIASARLFKAAALWAEAWPQRATWESEHLHTMSISRLTAALLWRALAKRAGLKRS